MAAADSEQVNKTDTGLTPKQQMAADEYLVDLNQTRAYVAAGYSEKGASQGAARLFANVKVQAYIAAKLTPIKQNLGITTERVLSELAKLAFFDPRMMFNSDGSPKQILDLDDDTAACVAGLEVAELFEGDGEQKHAYGLMKKIKLADKRAALVDLGKHLGLFVQKVQLTGKDGKDLCFRFERLGDKRVKK